MLYCPCVTIVHACVNEVLSMVNLLRGMRDILSKPINSTGEKKTLEYNRKVWCHFPFKFANSKKPGDCLLHLIKIFSNHEHIELPTHENYWMYHVHMWKVTMED